MSVAVDLARLDSFLRRQGFTIVRVVLGLVLLLAAGMKGYGLVTGSVVETSFFSSRWNQIAIIEGEIFLALWLLTGFFPTILWITTFSCFILFTIYSLYQAVTEAESCGCLGALIQINPWYTFLFDAIVLFVLLLVQPDKSSTQNRIIARRKILVASFLSLLVLTSIGLVLVSFSVTATLNEEGQIEGAGKTIAIDPANWIGKQFPLTKFIDIGSQLQRGRWIVVLYHWECPRCRDIVAQYVALAHHLQNQSRDLKIALIEVPPHKEEPSQVPVSESGYMRGKLTDRHQWIVNAPRFFRLNGGKVELETKSGETILEELAGQQTDRPEEKGRLFPDYLAIRRKRFLEQVACGPLALIAVLRKLDIDLSVQETEQLLEEAGSTGIDMLRLKNLAEENQVHALGVSISPENLHKIGKPAIVHLDGIGFAAVVGFENDGFRVVYPLKPEGIVPSDLFQRSFGKTGHALLVSRSPLSPEDLGIARQGKDSSPPKGPHVSLSSNVLAVGRIHRQNFQSSVLITNDGTEDLEIMEISSDYKYLTGKVEKKKLVPGESTTLKADGKQVLLGGFTWTVAIKTNQPGHDTVVIPVRGYLEQPVGIRQPAVKIGPVLVGQKADLEVPIHLSSDLKWNQLVTKVPEKFPLTAKVKLNGNNELVIILQWQGSMKKGWHRPRVDILAGAWPDALPSPLHLAVEVVPVVEVFPPSSFISDGELSKGDWKRSFLCTWNKNLGQEIKVRLDNEQFAKQVNITVSSTSTGQMKIQMEPASKEAIGFRGRVHMQIRLAEKTIETVPFFIGDGSYSQ